MFGTSLRRLEEELAALDAEISRHAMALVRNGASPEQLLAELKPLTTRSVELKDRIRRKTPWRRLQARRDELQRALATMPESRERQGMKLELLQLDIYLTHNLRRKPMTLAAFVLFAAVVFVMVVLPPLLVDWLAP